eukprot:6004956-Karenia_brevis.AAC.1
MRENTQVLTVGTIDQREDEGEGVPEVSTALGGSRQGEGINGSQQSGMQFTNKIMMSVQISNFRGSEDEIQTAKSANSELA